VKSALPHCLAGELGLSNKGFTLLEVLVTIAILAFGILALTKLQVLAVRGTSFNKDAVVATTLAQKVIEDFKVVKYGVDPSKCGTTESNMTITCSSVPQGNSPYGYKELTVTVLWDSPIKKISLNTVIAER
jgi:prepilin-type N-terminal cleavage/methylation domain-containing protein